MADKEYVSADAMVRDSFALARKIYDSGYRPDAIVVLWRGGTPVGIVVHEFLLYMGIETYHTVVKAASYTNIGERHEPRVENLDRVIERLGPESRVLLVDDIFDSGRTVAHVCEALRGHAAQIRVATLYLHKGHNETRLAPDFYQRETESWIVFPHELAGLSPDEIRQKDPLLANLITPPSSR